MSFIDNRRNLRYYYIVMRFSRLVILAMGTGALFCFGASGPTASVTDIAAMANLGVGGGTGSDTNAVAKAATQRALIEAWSEVENTEGAIPLETVSFPLTTYPDGSVRIQFKAEHALLPQEEKDFVRGKGILMEMYEPGGVMSGIFMSTNCIFDRVTRTGYCEGWIRVQYQNIKITGTNMVWDLEAQNVKVLSGARVVVNQFLTDLGKAFRK